MYSKMHYNIKVYNFFLCFHNYVNALLDVLFSHFRSQMHGNNYYDKMHDSGKLSSNIHWTHSHFITVPSNVTPFRHYVHTTASSVEENDSF